MMMQKMSGLSLVEVVLKRVLFPLDVSDKTVRGYRAEGHETVSTEFLLDRSMSAFCPSPPLWEYPCGQHSLPSWPSPRYRI